MSEIALSRGQVALVSDEDYDFLSQFKWHAVWETLTKSYYAEAWGYAPHKHREMMHRMVMGCQKRDGIHVDHINGNTLDNQRGNLRKVNHSQNQMNRKLQSIGSSGHRGVSFCRQTGKWKARLMLDQKEIWLGRFASEEQAITAVRAAHVEHYGEYARLA